MRITMSDMQVPGEPPKRIREYTLNPRESVGEYDSVEDWEKKKRKRRLDKHYEYVVDGKRMTSVEFDAWVKTQKK
jgi:hypothetical protein